MTQAQLHRAVAKSTGEDVEWIARRGFALVEDEDPIGDDDWERLALDWDEYEAERLMSRRS